MNLLIKRIYGIWIIRPYYHRHSGVKFAYSVADIITKDPVIDYHRALDLARKWWRR